MLLISLQKAKVLLDSGSQLNLLDIYFPKENNIPFLTETDFPNVSGIGGNQEILGETLSISLKYNNHNCKTKFYIVDPPSYCAILETYWLTKHNPTLNFSTKELTLNSNYSKSNGLLLPSVYTTFVVSKNYRSNINKHSNDSNNYNNYNYSNDSNESNDNIMKFLLSNFNLT